MSSFSIVIPSFEITSSMLWSWKFGLFLLLFFSFVCFRFYRVLDERGDEADFELFLLLMFVPLGIIFISTDIFDKDEALRGIMEYKERPFILLFYLAFPVWITCHLIRSIWFV